ncbi:MAG: tRNA (adenosine(37)-N6)-dimethylallyltransferase MiaA [Carboxydocellales bacterium]
MEEVYVPMLPNLIIVVGPTAVGKTAVGIELAKLIKGEVISGDSMQVYRQMDIGTAKPSKEEMQGIPHHMVDILEPDSEFSVAMFQEKVDALILAINDRGKVPILVGGTGLYVRAITDRHSFTPFAANWEYRDELLAQAQAKGNEWLHLTLGEVDPIAAGKIHSNDLRRIIRALEVHHFTGKSISQFQKEDQIANNSPKYNLFMYGLTLNREKLYQKINFRVGKMIVDGLVEEVQGLLNRGYCSELVSMKGLGYKEIIGYLRGDYDLPEAIRLLQRNTRHFAKRQLTWFGKEERICWIDVEKHECATEIAKEILRQIAGQLTPM